MKKCDRKHPLVVIVKPDPKRGSGWRLRIYNPNLKTFSKVTIPRDNAGTAEEREAYAITISREHAYACGQEQAFIRGELAAESAALKQPVVFVELPTGVDGVALFVYVVEIKGVGCKVGITTDPRRRISQHVATANAHKRIIGRVWVSQRCDTAKEIESKLIGTARNEYLTASFKALVFRARLLGATGGEPVATTWRIGPEPTTTAAAAATNSA